MKEMILSMLKGMLPKQGDCRVIWQTDERSRAGYTIISIVIHDQKNNKPIAEIHTAIPK